MPFLLLATVAVLATLPAIIYLLATGGIDAIKESLREDL